MDQPCQTLTKEPKNTLHLIYHSITSSEESASLRIEPEPTFDQKLQEISEQINLNGLTQTNQLTNLVVESACVTNDYIALLLDNGRVCRISYKCKLNETKTESNNSSNNNINKTNETNNFRNFNNQKNSKLGSSSSSVGNNNSVTLNSSSTSQYRQQQNLSRHSFSNSNLREAFIIPSPHDLIVQNSNSISSYPVFNSNSSRNRRHGSTHYNSHHILRGRVNSLIVGSSRIPTSILPASAVPESLIESVQTVLQSKSRSVIIRELQRTNLDVNLAVNNLLQRDDEGDDQTDDDEDPLSAVAVAAAAAAVAVTTNNPNSTTTTTTAPTPSSQNTESYIHGDDLMSLLDINSNATQNSEVAPPNPNENDSSSNSSSSSGSTITTSQNTNTTTTNANNQSLFDEENFRLIRRFGNSIISSRNSENERDTSSGNSTRKTSSYRLRDNRWYESYRDELFSRAENDDKVKKTENTSQSKEMSCENTISFGENIQYWIEQIGDTPQFVKIASLYSELIAVSKEGRLHQWKWSSDIPFSMEIDCDNSEKKIVYHPKCISLGLLDEKILGLSTSLIRGSCWTESGKVASWFDESVDIPNLTCKFENECMNFIFNDKNIATNAEKIIEMSSSNLFSVFRTSLGSVYWWGLMPYDLRLKTLEKQQNKSQLKTKPNNSGSNSSNEIIVGSYVSLKSQPIFNIGTMGIAVREGQPLIGQLTEHIFSYRENKSYKFKIKKMNALISDLNLSQSNVTPSSPTISSPQPLVIQGSLKRKKQYLIQENKKINLEETKDESDSEKEDREESWMLSDVFFLDDPKSSNILGQVIKIDSDYVLVKMSDSKNDSQVDLLENTRIFSKNQLQLECSNTCNSKSNCDQFFQKNPKKLNDIVNVLTCCAQQNYIHAILNKENTLTYIQYDLSNGKFLKEKRFPTNSISSFCGNNLNNISLRTIDEPNFNLLTLFDGNSTIYPLVDLQSSNTLKDPEWKNLFPIKSFSQSVLIPIKSPSTLTNPQSKKIHFVTLFSMKIEQLMASILRCDLNRVYKILRQLENDLSLVGTNANSKRLKRIMNERCDGNRNIIHAAVYSCSPVSNNQLNITANLSSDIKNSSDSSSETYTPQSSNKIERPWSVSFQNQSPKNDKKLNISLPSLQIQSFTNSEASNSSANTSPSQANMSVPFWPPPPLPLPQQDQQQQKNNLTQIFTPVKLSEKEKLENSLKILHLLLNSPVINGKLQNKNPNNSQNIAPNANFLFDLLSHKNSNGETPFMYAINLRAYDAALLILDIALQIRLDLTKTILLQEKDANFYNRDLLFTNMIYPLGSRTNQSPLYVLCSNDTCSFTWTGDNHITQDIFECKTCSLVGNLCCCTECARTCHKGHDCRIKKSSPTAYCDCWEKCKCKSLIAGDQDKRLELFDKLLKETNLLANSMNKNSEHLLLSLIQTCSRQIQEQKNYRRHTGNSSASSTSSNSSNYKKKLQIGEMPQHDLEPPKFSLKALQRIFTDFDSIKQIFLLNDSKFINNSSSTKDILFDESFYLENQSGCQDLDKFLFFLIQKCPNQLLITLVDSIKLTLQKETGEKLIKCKRVVQRLLNSVSRLFVILCIETSPANLQLNLENSLPNCPNTAKLIRQPKTENQISLITVSPIAKCEFVFKEFCDYSCLELVNTANSLISPVISGLSKPTVFKLQTSTNSTTSTTTTSTTTTSTNTHTEFTTNLQNSLSDEIFNIEPSLYRQNTNFISTNLVLPLEQINFDSNKMSFGKKQSKKRFKSSGSFSSEALSESTEDSSTSDSSNDTSSAVKNGKSGRAFLKTKKNSQPLSNIYESTQSDINSDQSNLDKDDSEQKSHSEPTESDDDEDEDDDEDDDDDDSDDYFKGGEQIKIEDLDSENEEMDESEDESDEEIEEECDFEFSLEEKKDQKVEKQIENNKKPDNSRIPIPSRTNRINSHVSSLIQQYGSSSSNEFYNNFYSVNNSMENSTTTTTTTSTTATTATNQIPSSNTSISTTTTSSSLTLETNLSAQNTPSSVQITNNTLSRIFSILLKLIRELLNMSRDKENYTQLKKQIDEKLKNVFKWINSVMDSTESQLRFGAAFSSIQLNDLGNIDSAQYLRHLEEKALLSNYNVNNSLPFVNGQSSYMNNLSSSNTFSSRFGSGIDARRKLNIMQHQHQQANSQNSNLQSQINSPQLITSYREFMNYTLSLMRRETNEHRDTLSHIDIAQLKHVAYALDGFLFYTRHDKLKTKSGDHDYDSSSSDSSSSDDESDDENNINLSKNEDIEMKNDEAENIIKKEKLSCRKSRFFKRSRSVLCVGGRSPDPFRHSIDESLPLASKPHLLQPHSRIQDMFKCKTNDLDEFKNLSNLGLSLMDDKLKDLTDDKTIDVIDDANLKKFEKSIFKLVRKKTKKSDGNNPNELLNKWRLTCDLFGRVFCDDIGAEIGSTIRQMAGFQLKESKFRREMERLKNLASKELIMEVERDREKLLLSTFKSLNNMFNLQCSRRTTNSNGTTQPPPLCLSRIKVTFKEEQGEGTGVARSFYTAFSDAVLADLEFPQFDLNSLSTCQKTSSSNTQHVPFSMQRYRNVRSSLYSERHNRSNNNLSGPNSNVILRSSLRPRELLSTYISSQVQNQETIVNLSESNEVDMSKFENDNLPLFWQSDKKSANCFFYSPIAGKNSPSRLNAFRNIGRIIGICLLQNELCPITLSRHVIKYILNRPIRWHDLAFYDSQMYESFRKMISDGEQFLIEKITNDLASSKTGSKKALHDIFMQSIEQCNEQIFNCLDLSFNIDLPKEENTNLNVDLVENGSKIQVNCVNMYEFVKLYSEFRMVKNVELCLKELKSGIFDVLPANALDGLYPEDFRLLLNGVADINIRVLASYTTISDESKESAKRAQFEKWFWSTVDKMTQQEKQELLFFWTGSPYLPASEEGFQPLPTITLRPHSDQLLPTANTCINRLYIPIYSSKSILKSKLLLAIKTKTFGFV